MVRPTPAINIKLRCGKCLSNRGRRRATTIDPPPLAASARAVSVSDPPHRYLTSTTVFTMTIEPAADTAKAMANTPRRRGVLR